MENSSNQQSENDSLAIVIFFCASVLIRQDIMKCCRSVRLFFRDLSMNLLLAFKAMSLHILSWSERMRWALARRLAMLATISKKSHDSKYQVNRASCSAFPGDIQVSFTLCFLQLGSASESLCLLSMSECVRLWQPHLFTRLIIFCCTFWSAEACTQSNLH